MASSVFLEGESFDLNFALRTDFCKQDNLNSETLRGKFHCEIRNQPVNFQKTLVLKRTTPLHDNILSFKKMIIVKNMRKY